MSLDKKDRVRAPSSSHEMTSGNIWRAILLFSLPLMLGSAFQQVYTLTDTAIVGREIGVKGLAALGACDLLVWLLSSGIQAYTEGFSIRMAFCFGARDSEKFRRTAATALRLCVIMGAALLVIVELFISSALKLMQVQPEIYPLTLTYCRIIFLNIPFVMCYSFAFSVMRAIGNSRLPLYAMLISTGMNIVLDILFVIVFKWGIGGAALATLLAQMFCALYSVVKVKALLPAGVLKGYDSALAPWMLKLSLPMMLQLFISATGGLAIQTVVNGYEISFIAGYTATYKLYGLLEMAAISYGYAITTFTSQNLGVGDMCRIKRGFFSSGLIALGTSILTGLLMVLTGERIVALFISGTAEEVSAAVSVGYEFLAIMSVALPLLYSDHALKSFVQGMGHAGLTTLNSIFELAARTCGAWILPLYFGQRSILFSEPLAWGVGTLILSVCSVLVYKKKKTAVSPTAGSV